MSLLQTNRGKMAANTVHGDEETLEERRSVSSESFRSSRAASAEAEGSREGSSDDDDAGSTGQGTSQERIGGSGDEENSDSDSARDEGNDQEHWQGGEQGGDTRGNGHRESDNELGSPNAWAKGVLEVTFGYFLFHSFMCLKCHFKCHTATRMMLACGMRHAACKP